MMEIHVETDHAKLFDLTAAHIGARLERHLEGHETVVLGVPGGRSAAGVFSALRKQPLPWHRIHFFMVDERLVPLAHDDSNFKILDEALVAPLTESGALPAGNVHPFVMDKAQPDYGIARYGDMLREMGGIHHLVFLSMGEDGHVASLFPGACLPAPSKSDYLLVEDAPKPPPLRMSVSPHLMIKSLSAVLLCVGAAKKEACRKMFDPTVPVAACPAKLIFSLPDAVFMTDLVL